MTVPLLLASSSVTRIKLLKQITPHFTQVDPDINESPKDGETPESLVTRLAQEKAEKVAQTHPNHLIIAADQTLMHPQYGFMGKPLTASRAKEQLMACSGKKLTFYTGLCLFNSNNGTSNNQLALAKVCYHHFSAERADAYIQKEQPFYCAGSIKVDALGACLIRSIESNDPNTILGLPLLILNTMLQEQNYDLLTNQPMNFQHSE
jgi:septum formation protein